MLVLATIAIVSAVRFDGSEPDGDEYDESITRSSRSKWRPKKDFNIHIVKKHGRRGKVRQIHLYPVRSNYRDDRDRDRDSNSESETREHTSKQQESAAAESSKVEKMIEVDSGDQDNAGSDHHHYEHKQKIKIKRK